MGGESRLSPRIKFPEIYVKSSQNHSFCREFSERFNFFIHFGVTLLQRLQNPLWKKNKWDHSNPWILWRHNTRRIFTEIISESIFIKNMKATEKNQFLTYTNPLYRPDWSWHPELITTSVAWRFKEGALSYPHKSQVLGLLPWCFHNTIVWCHCGKIAPQARLIFALFHTTSVLIQNGE